MRTLIVGLALWASAAMGQTRGGGGGAPSIGGGGPFMVSAQALQSELTLSAAQVERVGPTLSGLAAKYRDEMAALRDLPIADRVPRKRTLLKAMNDEMKTSVKFTSEQCRRFDQVSLQHRRFAVFSDPEVIGRLKLTADQQLTIGEIFRDSRRRMLEITKEAAADPAAARQRAVELERAMTAQVVALFNAEQKAVWTDLIGTLFEFP